MKIVLASNNRGKVQELQAGLAPLGIEVVPQGQFGFVEAEQQAYSFDEKANIKARHASQHTAIPAIAEDSG